MEISRTLLCVFCVLVLLAIGLSAWALANSETKDSNDKVTNTTQVVDVDLPICDAYGMSTGVILSTHNTSSATIFENLTGSWSGTNLNSFEASSESGGGLTYTGEKTIMCKASATFSGTDQENSDQISIGISLNGDPPTTTSSAEIENISGEVSITVTSLIQVTKNDTLSFMIANTVDNSAFNVVSANFVIICVGFV
jgi:hypothetical protein